MFRARMLYVIMRYIRTILPISLHLLLTQKKQKNFPINNTQNDSNKTTGRIYSFLTNSRNVDNFRLTPL